MSAAEFSLDCGDINRMVRSKYGWMLYNRNDRYIGKSIELLGEYSEEEVLGFQQIVSAGDVIVEAGANIGTHTVPLARMVGPSGRVLAFEAQRIVFQTLCANVALNGLTNVDAHWCALGSERGQLTVPEMNFHATNNFGGLNLESHSQGYPVPLTTLDSLQLPQLKLLKADVEGMELPVLRGASETIARCRPVLYLENDRKDRSNDLMQHIQSLGYRMFSHRPRMYRNDNHFGCQEDPFGNIVSDNLLCVHGSLEINIQGLPEVFPE